MTGKGGGRGRFVRGARWMVRRNLAAMAIGVAMLLLAVVFAVSPPHSAFLVVVLGVTSSLVLTIAVLGRSRLKKLPLLVLVAGFWSGIMVGPWAHQAVLQLAGHDESCQYVDSTDHQSQDSNGYTTTTTVWIVDCPDGRHTFSTDQNAEITDQDGSIPMRTAGPLIGATPVGQANDDALWFLALPGLAVLISSLITALRTPRGPTDTLPTPLTSRSEANIKDRIPTDNDQDSSPSIAPQS
jgi:hypothetical protein